MYACNEIWQEPGLNPIKKAVIRPFVLRCYLARESGVADIYFLTLGTIHL